MEHWLKMIELINKYVLLLIKKTLLIVLFCLTWAGGIQHIEKANAEEFIHIFVNNSAKLTEFLEHMVEVCTEIKLWMIF